MSDQQTIRIMCPKLTCRRVLAVPTSARGRTVRCRGCGSTVRIPTTAAASQPKKQPAEEQQTTPAESTNG